MLPPTQSLDVERDLFFTYSLTNSIESWFKM